MQQCQSVHQHHTHANSIAGWVTDHTDSAQARYAHPKVLFGGTLKGSQHTQTSNCMRHMLCAPMPCGLASGSAQLDHHATRQAHSSAPGTWGAQRATHTQGGTPGDAAVASYCLPARTPAAAAVGACAGALFSAAGHCPAHTQPAHSLSTPQSQTQEIHTQAGNSAAALKMAQPAIGSTPALCTSMPQLQET